MQFGFAETVAHWGRYRATDTAIIEDGRRISYSELDRRADQVAALLTRERIHGDRIGVALTSKASTLATIVGILRIGRSVVMLHHGLPPGTLEVNLADTKPGAIVHDDAFAVYAKTLVDNFGGASIAYERTERADALTEAELNRIPSVESNEEWGIVFSSGTTGPPKAIERDHYSMITEGLGWCLELGIRRGTYSYIGRPIFYTGGLVLALAGLLSCSTLVLDNYADNEDASEVWKDYQRVAGELAVDWAFFIPDQLRAFLKLAAESRNLKGAKAILVMGSPITGAEKLEVNGLMGSDVVESWGNSESLGTITDPEDLAKRPDSIGRPFLTDEMCVVDEEGRKLPPGTTGRLAGGLEAGFIAYSNRPDDTRRVKRHDLIISEDLGYIDQEGYFYVVGRVQDSVVIKGKSILLREIEDRIRALPDVSECAVSVLDIGEDLRLGAVIVYTPDGKGDDTSGAALKERLLQAINNEVPLQERIEELTLVERIPRLPVGKVDREAVRKILTKGAYQFAPAPKQ